MKKVSNIFINSIPILIMIGLIPFVPNDYVLTLLYIAIITTALFIKRTKNDFMVLIFGFLIITFMEFLFTSTGVETFTRTSLLWSMPVWLPFLWAYGFVAIKRSIEILNN